MPHVILFLLYSEWGVWHSEWRDVHLTALVAVLVASPVDLSDAPVDRVSSSIPFRGISTFVPKH